MSRPVVWSFGGGKQSVAIAVLIVQGRLPKPERIVIADTGREATEVWRYLTDVVNPGLAEVGCQVEVAPHSLATVDVYAKNGDLLLPVFTADGGKMPTLCSNEWKRRVVQRWCRQRGYGPRNPVRMWLGISVDEIARAKPSGVEWQEYHWPLLFDVPLRRDECITLVRDAGWPDPPRSSCWMCPHRSNAEWRDLRDHHPDDFARAVALEASIQARDERDGKVYLHRQRVPLAEARIDEENADLFDACDSGFCFV